VYDNYLSFMKQMEKINVTISLREDIWKKYQEYCKENDLIPSYEFQKIMKEQINANNS